MPETETRAAEWRVGRNGVPWRVPVFLPKHSAPECGARSGGYGCNRAQGHTGRHAAVGWEWDLIAVWHG